MRRSLLVLGLLGGCAEWGVELTLVGSTPLPVEIGDAVELPVGVVATVVATATRNGEAVEGAVELESMEPSVLDVALVAGDAEDRWALIGVSPGATGLVAWVDDDRQILLSANVTEQ